jgi:hypothetical protein
MGGGGDVGGHVLRETTSRGLCGLVCPSRTSERGGEGDCVKEGGGEEGKCERERALEAAENPLQSCSGLLHPWTLRRGLQRGQQRGLHDEAPFYSVRLISNELHQI